MHPSLHGRLWSLFQAMSQLSFRIYSQGAAALVITQNTSTLQKCPLTDAATSIISYNGVKEMTNKRQFKRVVTALLDGATMPLNYTNASGTCQIKSMSTDTLLTHPQLRIDKGRIRCSVLSRWFRMHGRRHGVAGIVFCQVRKGVRVTRIRTPQKLAMAPPITFIKESEKC